MKLKSLLLGSAAALALSTGAQAADPIVDFVSLDVCDAYGISGLTISSDDTCLQISGSVNYTFENANYGAGFGAPTGFFTDSEVEWQLLFDATTQTDAGAAKAVIRLNDNPDAVDGGTGGGRGVRMERAYVSFGDTTVITAGRTGSIFDTEILDRQYGALAFDEIDNEYLAGGFGLGGESIQIESLIADGFSVLAALEGLQSDGASPSGIAGLAVAYDGGGISGELGVLLNDIFGDAENVNYYGRVTAAFDGFSVRGGFLADDTGDWIATLGAGATFDMFTLDVDAAFSEDDDFAVAGEAGFGATDTINVYVGAAYAESAGIMTAYYYDNGSIGGETFAVYGGVNADVTETIVANAEVGYVDYDGGDLVYGAAGVTYAPGGGFTTGLDVYGDTDDAYAVTFNARKSF